MLLLRKKYNLIFHCIAFITAFATGSCKKTDVNDAASVFLDESVLSEAIPLQMEDAWYPADSIYSVRFYVYADTMLIIENNRLAGNYLDFYNIRPNGSLPRNCSTGKGQANGCSHKSTTKGAPSMPLTTSTPASATWTCKK